MPVCTSCHQTKADDAFFHKNKKWKTCQNCIEQRAAKKASKRRKREEEVSIVNDPMVEDEDLVRASLRTVNLLELSDAISREIRALPTSSHMNSDGTAQGALSLKMAVNLTNMISDTEPPKEVARWIVEEIERADEYNWTYNCMNMSMRHKDVANFYYVCSQSVGAMKEYKEGSNRKRMERFRCAGKMQLKIDVPAAEAMLDIQHEMMHGRPPITSDVAQECLDEIEKNLAMNPIQLRNQLRAKNLIKNYTPRQIHVAWERIARTKNPALITQLNTPSLISSTQPATGDFAMSSTQQIPSFAVSLTSGILVQSPPPPPPPPPPLPSPRRDELPERGKWEELNEYVRKMEQFSKRVREQLQQKNYLWLQTVKVMTASVIEIENDIEELERQRAAERASKPWMVHYK